MTKEEVIEMAIKVGIKRRTDEFYSEFCDGVYFDDFVTFAKLIAEKEREECAKTCENIALGLTKWPESFEGLTAETKLMRSMGEFVHKPFVDAIRARGQDATT